MHTRIRGCDLLQSVASGFNDGQVSDSVRTRVQCDLSYKWFVAKGNDDCRQAEETWLCYNIAKDIGESKDLAASEAGRVVELQKLYDAWSAQQAEPTVKDKPANNAPKKNGEKTKAA